MRVHRPAPSSMALEGVPAGRQRDRQPDRRPQRIPPAHPVAEPEHPLRARCRTPPTALLVGGQRGEMRPHRRLAERARDPGAGGAAFSAVSSVVKVFDATSTSVRAGIELALQCREARGRPRWTGSAPVACAPCARVSASVAMRGPRSEPPMPIFSTVSKRSPVAPRSVPSCTLATKSRIFARSAAAMRRWRPRCRRAAPRASRRPRARAAPCAWRRGPRSRSPARRRTGGGGTPRSPASWARSSSATSASPSIDVLEKSIVRSSSASGEAPRPVGVGGEQRPDVRRPRDGQRERRDAASVSRR